MRIEGEKLLITRFLDEGLLTPEILADAEKSLLQNHLSSDQKIKPHHLQWGRIIACLLERNVLTISQVMQAAGDIQKDLSDSATDESSHKTQHIDTEKSNAAKTTRNQRMQNYEDMTKPDMIGPYRITKILGKGGMGKVYLAYDETLQRQVAIKVLRVEDDELARRFVLEARMQAQVDHEHVCQVYEIGDCEGKPYIAMQYIKGAPLHSAQKDLSLEQKLIVVQAICEALHAAHQNGLIHRDVKPGNIMIERKDDGRLKPYIMDFGLAREQRTSSLTMTGALLGTPSYMSPEQAQGRNELLDRRTDVYSLGVSLYELVCGSLPFSAESTAEVLVKILHEEAPPPRKVLPSIPRDLETIILTAIEKEPHLRYQSALAFGEDIKRFLDGDPITARPLGLGYRLQKKVRKNKLLSSVITLATITCSIFLSLWVNEMWQLEKKTALAQQFGHEVSEIEAILRYAYLTPLHNTEKIRQRLSDVISHIKEQMVLLGPIADGPGHYALGKVYFALEDFEKAKEEFTYAQNAGNSSPEIALYFGQTLGKLYQLAMNRIRVIQDAQQRASEEKKVDEKYRIPAGQYLLKGQQSSLLSSDYVAALLAYYKNDRDKAYVLAEEAVQTIPWLYEAYLLQSTIVIDQALEARFAGEYDRAEIRFKTAAALLDKAAEIGESDPAVYRLFCRMYKWWMYFVVYDTAGDPESIIQAMQKQFEKTIISNPQEIEARTDLAESYRLFAESRMNRRENPLDILELSAEMAQSALNINEEDPEALHHLGNARGLAAFYEFRMTGETSSTMINDAVKALEKATTIAPQDYRIQLDLGNMYSFLGEITASKDKNPLPHWQRSEKAFLESSRLAPRYTFAYNNLGLCYLRIAQWKTKNDVEPTRELEQAIAALKKAISINPNFAYAMVNQAEAHLLLARWQLKNNVDCAESLQNVIDSAKQALSLNKELGFVQETIEKARGLQKDCKAE